MNWYHLLNCKLGIVGFFFILLYNSCIRVVYDNLLERFEEVLHHIIKTGLEI